MGKAAREVGALALALLVICAVCRAAFFREYNLYIPDSPVRNGTELRPVSDRPDVVRVREMETRPGGIRLRIHPEASGDAAIELVDENGESRGLYMFRVSPMHTVYDRQTGGFNGDWVVMIAVTLFWLSVSVIMIRSYRQARGAAYYAYSTIYYAGFSLFSLVVGAMTAVVTVRHILNPWEWSMLDSYDVIRGASRQFMELTTPLVVIFAAAMAVSNIVLLRRERLGRQNLMGLIVSLLLIGGEALGWMLFTRNLSGSEQQVRIADTVGNVYATLFVYFECMLAGSVVCGVTAARREPPADRDFIVILGCWFRPDGTLPPLIRGRVDRAVAFWRKQKETTGKEAFLIPSGGQGPDEPMPEADAMRLYLLEQHIPDELILPERESGNTKENMIFSRRIIEQMNPEGRTAFATTSYHVFRGGVWAAETGLQAEGMGQRTRWWYWPNAFMRECAGLLLTRWKQEIVLLAVLTAFFGALSMTLG